VSDEQRKSEERIREAEARLAEAQAREAEANKKLSAIETPAASGTDDPEVAFYQDSVVAPITKQFEAQLDKRMERVDKFVELQARKESQLLAEQELQAHVAKRASEGMQLSPEVQTNMREMWVNQVAGTELAGVVNLDRVESLALGDAQKMALQQRAAQAQAQAQVGASGTPSPTPVVSGPTLPVVGEDPDKKTTWGAGDKFAPVNTDDPNWQREFFAKFGDVDISPTQEVTTNPDEDLDWMRQG
jgi:hypothetical protein